jgi:hypothetical protein
VLLPFTEHACDWDNFPSASNDLELQVICCLCAIGLFLVLARELRFTVQAFRAPFIFGAVSQMLDPKIELRLLPRHGSAAIPLRI